MMWKKLTKIAISGSRRGFSSLDLIPMWIDKYIRENFKSTEDVVLITGGSPGVDECVEMYCIRRGIKNLIVPARWLELEKVAGPRRNRHIIDLAHQFVGFWNGSMETSPGTLNAIQRAKEKGIIRHIFTPKSLMKVLDIQPPVKVRLPKGIKGSDIAGKGRKASRDTIESLMRDAGLIEKKKKPKKIQSIFEDEDFKQENGR